MTVLAFDTLKVVKRLKEAGFSDPQAEAVTDVLRDAQETNFTTLVTKDDLRIGLDSLEQRMTIKFGGMMVVAVGAITALVRLL